MVTRLPGKTPWWRSQRVCPQHLETEAEWCQDVGRGHWSESSKGKPPAPRCAQAPCPPCAQHPSRSTRRRSCRMRRSGSGSLACPPKNPKGHKGPSHTLTLQGWKLRPGRSRDLSRLHREQIAGLSKPGLPGTAPHVGLGTLPQPPHHHAEGAGGRGARPGSEQHGEETETGGGPLARPREVSRSQGLSGLMGKARHLPTPPAPAVSRGAEKSRPRRRQNLGRSSRGEWFLVRWLLPRLEGAALPSAVQRPLAKSGFPWFAERLNTDAPFVFR